MPKKKKEKVGSGRGLVSDEEFARTGRGYVLKCGVLPSVFKAADAPGSEGLSGGGIGLADSTLRSRGLKGRMVT